MHFVRVPMTLHELNGASVIHRDCFQDEHTCVYLVSAYVSIRRAGVAHHGRVQVHAACKLLSAGSPSAMLRSSPAAHPGSSHTVSALVNLHAG